MTHLTPGASALLDGKTVVEINACDASMVMLKPYGGERKITDLSRLTPLLTAVVQEDGTVREANPLGNSPRITATFQEFAAGHEKVFEDQIHNEKWQAAEASRRTWEVTEEPISAELIFDLTPGTTVLGYVPAGKFIIVETK